MPDSFYNRYGVWFMKYRIISLLAAICLLFSACSIISEDSIIGGGQGSVSIVTGSDARDLLKVHILDVGQGDSILLQCGGSSMLIDAGNNADAGLVTGYLKKQGIKRLDYLIGTHPHEDHIGSLDAVIKAFDIGKIYMPEVTSTTKTFKDVILAIKDKGMTIEKPVPGTGFKLGNAECSILAPVGSEYEDLNNYSIVIKVVFGETSFLFTGDAQTVSEDEMISRGYDLTADVLKVGHHGSHSSTGDVFLDRVRPEYAVISCAEVNDYGHPHKETVEKLQERGIIVYRTDESGTIICTSDGGKISFSAAPGSYKSGEKKD